jgi:hypothetical protein
MDLCQHCGDEDPTQRMGLAMIGHGRSPLATRLLHLESVDVRRCEERGLAYRKQSLVNWCDSC